MHVLLRNKPVPSRDYLRVNVHRTAVGQPNAELSKSSGRGNSLCSRSVGRLFVVGEEGMFIPFLLGKGPMPAMGLLKPMSDSLV